MIPIVVYVPGIVTPSISNKRVCWQEKARWAKQQRAAVAAAWSRLGLPEPEFPLEVTLVRVAPRALDEGDNLNSALKAARDQVAECLGLKNDRDPRVTWEYEQQRGSRPREVGIKILVCDRDDLRREKLEDVEALVRTFLEVWEDVSLSGPPDRVRVASECVKSLRDVVGVGS